MTFTTPVTDRRAVERSIRISTPHNTTGHFEWVASNVVRWVPHRYWPPHTRVSVGVQELTEGFETGDALIGVASISAHTFTVSRNGEVLRTMPASLGKPSRPTPIGSFHAMSKERTVVMDSRTIGIPLNSSDGYLLTAHYAVRVTWSGVYVHSAPWSVNSQDTPTSATAVSTSARTTRHGTSTPSPLVIPLRWSASGTGRERAQL